MLFLAVGKSSINSGRNRNGLIAIVKYREMYSDLNAAFGDNRNAYLNHYRAFGATEGHEGRDENIVLVQAEEAARDAEEADHCFFPIGTICKVYPNGVKIFKRLSIWGEWTEDSNRAMTGCLTLQISAN